MTTSLGFVVTEVLRTPEPASPDPFIAALERADQGATGQADPPPCQPLGVRLGLAGDVDD